MTSMIFFDQWFFRLGAILLSAMCLVWSLMLIGALAASLENPRGLFKLIVLKEKYASTIMGGMTKELVILISAGGLVIAAVLNQVSLEKSYEKMATNLLSSYKPYSSGPAALDNFRVLSQLPGHFRETLLAYTAYEENPSFPNVEAIERRLPAKARNVYDLRLLGLAHYTLAFQKDPAERAESIAKSRQYLDAALAIAKTGDLPGNPDADIAGTLVYYIENTIAALSIAQIEAEIKANKNRLTDSLREQIKGVIKILDKHMLSPGNIPSTYHNLLICHTLLEEYDNAIEVLSFIASWRPPVSDFDKKTLYKWLTNLDQTSELIPLASYVKKKFRLEWSQFVERKIFSPAATR